MMTLKRKILLVSSKKIELKVDDSKNEIKLCCSS